MNSLGIYDECFKSGFTEPQSRILVKLFDEVSFAVMDIRKEIVSIKQDIKEIQLTTSHMERMIYTLGALTMGGFGLMAYVIKG